MPARQPAAPAPLLPRLGLYLGLCLTLLLAAGLRFYRIEFQSYWNDEGNTRVLISRDVPTLLRNAAADIHPPGYYLILRVWRGLLGESELALRSFSALAGVMLVALLYRLGREWFGRGAGLAAALFGAINPFLVYYSQEARMYALLAAVSAASFLFFVRLWRQRPPRSRWNWSLITLHGLLTAFGLYTHYAFGFVVLAQGAAVLLALAWAGLRVVRHAPHRPVTQTAISHQPLPDHPITHSSISPAPRLSVISPLILNYLCSQFLALLLYLPWLPTAYHQLTGWPAAREFHPLGGAFLDLARYLVFGRTVQTPEVLWGLGLIAALILVGCGFWVADSGFWPSASNPSTSNPSTSNPSTSNPSTSNPSTSNPSTLNPSTLNPSTLNPSTLNLEPLTLEPLALTLLWLFLPAGLTLTLGLLTEPFSKFLLVAVPALCLLLGAALTYSYPPSAIRHPPNHPIAQSPNTPWSLSLTPFPFVVWFLGFGILYFTGLSLANLYFNPAYFRDDYRGIAQLLTRLRRPGDLVITDAPNQAEAFDYYYRADQPGTPPLVPLPEARPLDPVQTAARLADLAGRYDRIFVLYWGDAQADPERFIESWLNAHTFKAGDQWFGQVRLATYAVARPAAEPAAPLAARFGEHIQLQGYTLRAADLAPGDIVQLTLFWQTDAPLAARYKVFVHVYEDVNAPPAAQEDGEPGGGLAFTTTWEPGRRYADNHGVLLPADLPAGEYRLMLGLYNLATGDRLPVAVGDTISGDRLDLGVITVR